MNRFTVTLAASLLLLTPVAVASWGFKGSFEPSTTRDANDGWMNKNPDVSPVTGNTQAGNAHKVYFNGFVTASNLGMPINPSTYDSRLAYAPNVYRLMGMMGVWKDCNKDNYVGLGDNGLMEYRSELLLDTSVCKPQAIPDPIPFNWFPVHNDGQWVHELVPISWTNASAEEWGDQNAFNLNDNGSRMWADFTLPESLAPGASCGINPQPAGTMHSTGGMLWFADCLTSYRVTDNSNAALGGGQVRVGVPNLAFLPPPPPPVIVTSPVNANALAGRQVTFGDKPREQYASQSILNQKTQWGEESDGSFVEAWDCTQPQLASVVVPMTQPATTGNGYIINVSAPRTTPGTSTTGSPSGTANSTASGFDECSRSTTPSPQGNGLPGVATHDHAGGVAARLPYTNEGGVNVPVKRNPDDWFTPVETSRPSQAFSPLLGRGAPNDGGTGAIAPFVPLAYTERDLPTGDKVIVERWAVASDDYWQGRTNWIATPGVNRADLDNVVARVQNWTYYASISPTAIAQFGLTMPKGGALGVYGTDQCLGQIGVGQPVRNGWDCAPANWHVDAAGKDIEPRSTFLGRHSPGESDTLATGVKFGTRVGATYNLRDIDCYDQSVGPARDNGVSWGTLSGTRCV